jgi:hypothetical protein
LHELIRWQDQSKLFYQEIMSASYTDDTARKKI